MGFPTLRSSSPFPGSEGTAGGQGVWVGLQLQIIFPLGAFDGRLPFLKVVEHFIESSRWACGGEDGNHRTERVW